MYCGVLGGKVGSGSHVNLAFDEGWNETRDLGHGHAIVAKYQYRNYPTASSITLFLFFTNVL